MVEEMMLLANVSVAQAIVNRFPSCSLLRRHQTPGGRERYYLCRSRGERLLCMWLEERLFFGAAFG
jgi:hypothetical protein